MSQFRKIVLCGGLAGAALVLSGCVVAPHPHRTHQSQVVVTQPQVTAEVEYVQTAPPAAYTEVVTVSPGVGYVWVPGLWLWSGGRYQWRAGAWSRPPVGYKQWNHGGWVHQPGRGWRHSGGHWR
jgi:hypothetical protein